jgi:hypothetical protein
MIRTVPVGASSNGSDMHEEASIGTVSASLRPSKNTEKTSTYRGTRMSAFYSSCFEIARATDRF